MKIAILSQDPSLYSTKRLKEACLKRGHKVRIFDPLFFTIIVEQGKPGLYYSTGKYKRRMLLENSVPVQPQLSSINVLEEAGTVIASSKNFKGKRWQQRRYDERSEEFSCKNKPLKPFDAIIPRIGASVTFYGTAVVRQFEQMGVFCLNPSLGITTSRDKLRSIQMLAKHNIGIPLSAFAKQRSSIKPAIEAVGGSPVVIKLLEGTQGIGVILADTDRVAEAIIETFQSTRQNVLIQKFIEESKGRDIRAIVVGNKVVAAMRRIAQGDEFRSNVHCGGRVEPVQLDPKFEQAAIRATQIMGLYVAGVDMLESKSGPKILEVNSSPGLEGIEEATKVDVAGAMIEFLEEQSSFPEIDLRQRLTMDKGYGIAEIQILGNSALKNRTIRDSGFKDKDIVIMSIKRERLTISNPLPSCEMLEGDSLLCFGKLDNMRLVIEENRQKRNNRLRLSIPVPAVDPP